MRYVALGPIIDHFNDIAQIVEKVDMVGDLANEDLYKELYDSMYGQIKAINNAIFQYQTLKDFDFDEISNYSEFFELLKKWTEVVACVLENRLKYYVKIDFNFYSLMDTARYVDKVLQIERTKELLLGHLDSNIEKFEEYYQTYHYFWGSLDVKKNDFSVIENRVGVLFDRVDDFIELYEMLGDYRSKKVLLNTLNSWITFDPKYLSDMCENNFSDYYDLDLLSCDENEVMVDLGAYIGDSAFDFIDSYGKYKKIYCYEMVEGTVDTMRENLKAFSNIDIRCKGVGSKPGVMYMSGDKDNSGSILNDKGEHEVEIVTIDDDISEPVTLIKMDIEGAEKDALMGCRNHILMDRPKLLICVYHSNTDILDIPKLIRGMRDDYKFYLRTNGKQYGPSETVLFAL